MPISLGVPECYSQVRSDSAAKRVLALSLMRKKSLSLNFFHFRIAGTVGLSYQGIKEKIEPGSSVSSQSNKRELSAIRAWLGGESSTVPRCRGGIPLLLPFQVLPAALKIKLTWDRLAGECQTKVQ